MKLVFQAMCIDWSRAHAPLNQAGTPLKVAFILIGNTFYRTYRYKEFTRKL